MRYSTVKKFISVFLAFSILNVNTFAFNLNSKEFIQLRSEIAQTIKPITDTDIRIKYRKEYNFRTLLKSINEQGQNNHYGEVCDGEICAPYHTFMRGLIGALIDFSEGNGTILINYTREIRNAAFMGALASRDIKPLRELLKAGAKEALDDCGSNPFFEGLEDMANTAKENLHIQQRDFSADRKAQDNCEKGLAGLSILSVVWENKQQADETADLIYKTLKKHYKGKFSSLVLLEGIAALSFIDTDYSYQLIEEFLTKDTIPSRIGTALREISFQGMYDSEERRIEEKYNNAQSYLNRINARWQYIDEEATKERGIDPSIFKQANSAAGQFDDEYLKAAYNVVYNNILTDIGTFLSAQEGRGRKLAKKIVKEFVVSNHKGDEMHIPLILGLIQNLDYADAINAAQIINKSFYYDIGGGTGSLIAQKSAIKSSGLNKRAKNTISENYFLTRAKIGRINFILDMFVSTVSMGFLALGITNTVANIYRLASLRSLRFTANMGTAANAGKTAQISQASKATQILPKTAPELPQPNTAVAALTQPEVTSTLALTPPKAHIEHPLGIPNVLLKIRNSSRSKGKLQLTSSNGNAQGSIPQSLSKMDKDVLNELAKSVLRVQFSSGGGSGFLTEIPLFGRQQQVIVTAGHVAKYPNESFYVYNDVVPPTDTDILFHTLFDKQNRSIDIYEDYALLLPREHIDAPSLPLDFENKFYNFREFTSMGFPSGKFTIKDYKLTPNTKEFARTPNIKYLGGEVKPGNSGGPVFVETAPNEYSVIGTVVASSNNGRDYTLVHTLGWLKKFIETGVTRPKFLDIDLSKKAFFNIFYKARRRGNITPTIDKASEEFNFPDGPLVNVVKTIRNGSNITTTMQDIDLSKFTFDAHAPFFTDFTGDITADLINASVLGSVETKELISVHDTMVQARAVWRLKNKKRKIIAYLKYGTKDEIERTKRFHEIVSKIDMSKYPLIKLNYPRIITEDISLLPARMRADIMNELQRIKGNLWGKGRGEVPFIMTPMESNGFTYFDVVGPDGRAKAMAKLEGKKITLEEWKQLEQLFAEINEKDFVHEDLDKNISLFRDGVLNVNTWDFEFGPYKVKSNKPDLDQFSTRFENNGIKESTNPYLNFRFK